MKYLVALFIMLQLPVLSGCTATPVSISHNMSFQQTMQSAHHWDVLANDVAAQIREVLRSKKMLYEPVYVQIPKETQFSEGFHNMLITALVNNGVKTLVQKSDAVLIVTCDAQVVFHSDLGKRSSIMLTGTTNVLTSGVIVSREGDAPHIQIGAGEVVAPGVIKDFWGTEVIITSSLEKGNEYFFRKTDTYYVNGADNWQYTTPKIVSQPDPPPAPPPLKTFKVTGDK